MAQQLVEILQITGTGKTLVAHQQAGRIHQLGIGRGLHCQQAIHHIPIQGMEGWLGLERTGIGGQGRTHGQERWNRESTPLQQGCSQVGPIFEQAVWVPTA